MIKDNLLLSTLTPLNKKLYEEILTAHNISVLLLIRSYITEKELLFLDFVEEIESINCRRGFCRLVLHLLQSPDFSFCQFVSLIRDPKYCLSHNVLYLFKSTVQKVISSEVEELLKCITDTGNYLIDPLSNDSCKPVSIHRCCPVGVFLRKMIVFLDKLTFPQTIKVYRLYQQYYLMDKNNLEEVAFIGKNQSGSVLPENKGQLSDSMMSEPSCSNIHECTAEPSQDMEITVYTQTPFMNPTIALFDVNPIPNENEKFAECLSWSHRQTELFLAEQATYLEFDENSALPPIELHRILNRIININPGYSEAYYVSYLNCLRVKEFNGALENLFQFFDTVNFIDKPKSYRYATLNLAILNVKFNNKLGAIAALRECVMLSHEANDNICLHISQAWLRCISENAEFKFIESTILKCEELELFQIASLSLQMYAQKFLNSGQGGDNIFNLLDKSDAINSQRSLPDLMLNSIAQRAATWCNYGQFNANLLISQILLHIDTSYATYKLTTYNTEAVCTCICNVASYLTNVGKYQIAKIVLSHAKDRFPHRFSEWWIICEQILYFEYSLHCNLWNDAYKAACQMTSINKYESKLRLAELSLEKGDKVGAAEQIDDLLAIIGNNKNGQFECSPHYVLRAYLSGARAKSGGASFFMLKKALTYAIRFGYPRFKALIKMEIAKLQLELGLVKQATQLAEKCSVTIFSENRLCEQAAVLTLLAKCNVALVRHLSTKNHQKIDYFKSAISKLDAAKIMYQKLDCMSKVKDIVYFQAILANEIGLHEMRNYYALEFRKIDAEQNYSHSCTSVFCSSL